MQGKIIKGIAGFYYVNVVESGLYECKAKGSFRKNGIKPLVGDEVELEVLDEEEKIGNVTKILPRKNELIRPAVANIDQALVVFAVTEPKPHYNLLDRFLVMSFCVLIRPILQNILRLQNWRKFMRPVAIRCCLPVQRKKKI